MFILKQVYWRILQLVRISLSKQTEYPSPPIFYHTPETISSKSKAQINKFCGAGIIFL